MKHIRSFTYIPKIHHVLSGECTQTIRPGWKIKASDSILFHGWEEKPYRSQWSWRLKVDVRSVENIRVNRDGIELSNEWGSILYEWNSKYVDRLANLDFIHPPTGLELKKVLNSYSKLTEEFNKYQIIWW